MNYYADIFSFKSQIRSFNCLLKTSTYTLVEMAIEIVVNAEGLGCQYISVWLFNSSSSEVGGGPSVLGRFGRLSEFRSGRLFCGRYCYFGGGELENSLFVVAPVDKTVAETRLVAGRPGVLTLNNLRDGFGMVFFWYPTFLDVRGKKSYDEFL